KRSRGAPAEEATPQAHWQALVGDGPTISLSAGLVSRAFRVLCTERAEAPGPQGARSAHIGDMHRGIASRSRQKSRARFSRARRKTSNAAGRDASALECQETKDAGH